MSFPVDHVLITFFWKPRALITLNVHVEKAGKQKQSIVIRILYDSLVLFYQTVLIILFMISLTLKATMPELVVKLDSQNQLAGHFHCGQRSLVRHRGLSKWPFKLSIFHALYNLTRLNSICNYISLKSKPSSQAVHTHIYIYNNNLYIIYTINIYLSNWSIADFFEHSDFSLTNPSDIVGLQQSHPCGESDNDGHLLISWLVNLPPPLTYHPQK